MHQMKEFVETQLKINQWSNILILTRVTADFVVPYVVYNTIFRLTTAMFTLVTRLSISYTIVSLLKCNFKVITVQALLFVSCNMHILSLIHFKVQKSL